MTTTDGSPTAPPVVPATAIGRDALALLDALVEATGGEQRDGQRTMTVAVADAMERRRHLVAEAPTGTGKTYALAAAAAAWLAGGLPDADEPDADPDRHDPDHADADGDEAEGRPSRRVVVTTATRALQDQLVGEDLPRVARVAAGMGMPFRFVVLKGRANYLCLSKAVFEATSVIPDDREVAEELMAEAFAAGDGERSTLTPVRDDVWRRLSVASTDCPGTAKCSKGAECFAERARRAAADADVIVVNTALYAAHLMSGGAVLPPHQVVVVDEAHALPDVLVDAASVMMSANRLRVLERTAREWASAGDAKKLLHAADGLADQLRDVEGEVDPTTGDLAVHLAEARTAAVAVAAACTDAEGDAAAQAATTAAGIAKELELLTEGDNRDRVAWCERDGRMYSSPVEAGELASELLWPAGTVVCVSATLRAADTAGSPTFDPFLAAAGAPTGTRTLTVPSPFDHAQQGLLYVPKGRIPSPRQDGWADGVADQLWHLARAAGGRTLALFTSRAATERTAEELQRRSTEEDAGIDVLTQWDGPRDLLVTALRTRRNVVLCATRSFWTGIDIPGDACVVVAIDRLPFPRPDDPLMKARRERAEDRGEDAFQTVDLPAAAMQLAQGVGRLIRSPDDRGVVAVLDTRLATARWRPRILGALPPFKRTVDLAEVEAFLADS